MRTQAVVIACIIAVASILIAWATAPSGPRGGRPPASAAATFAIGFDVPTVRTLHVSSAGLDASLSTEPDWTLTLPSTSGAGSTTWPANPDAVRVLLKELATQSIEHADHGGRNESALATVTIVGLDTSTTIRVLAPPLAGRLPIRITETSTGLNAEESSRIRDGFVPADRFRPTDAGQLAALADPRPFSQDGVFTQLTIKPGQAEAFTIERNAGIWSVPTVSGGPSPRIHQPTARAVIEDLRRVRASNVIVPFDVQSGKASPFLRIDAQTDLPRLPGTPRRTSSTTLTIFGQSTIEGSYDAVASRSSTKSAHENSVGSDADHRLQIHIDPQSFPVLPADLNTLLDPQPFPFELTDTTAFRVQTGEFEIDLHRTIDGWNNAGSPLQPGEIMALETLLAPLTEPSSVVFVRDPAHMQGEVRLTVESLTSSEPSEFTIAAGDDEKTLEISDGASVWVTDLSASGFAEAIAALPKVSRSP